MQEVNRNLWDFWHNGYWLVCTTNGTIKRNGACVMGRGIAKQVRNRFIGFDEVLGSRIKEQGNHVCVFEDHGVITFPVKHNWWEQADLPLIERSAQELLLLVETNDLLNKHEDYGYEIACPKVGCGNGGLLWQDVGPVVEPYFNTIGDRLLIVDFTESQRTR